MDAKIRSVDYFNVTVTDQPGETYRLLHRLADQEVNLYAFHAIPLGPAQTQFVVFPEDPERFVDAISTTGMCVSGPQKAFLVQGDDRLGALVEIHRKLFEKHVSVYGSNGVTDGRGGFGYVLYVRSGDFPAAAQALGI